MKSVFDRLNLPSWSSKRHALLHQILFLKTKNPEKDSQGFVRKTGRYIQYQISGLAQVGIGTTNPGSQLHIAGSNILDSARGAIIMSRYWVDSLDSRASAIYHFYNSGVGTDQLVLGVSGDGGPYTSPTKYSNAKMVIEANGNVGIGTTNPASILHVYAGPSGAIPFAFSPLVVESNGHTYINLLSPAANETAILFGQPGGFMNSANGVIMYNTSGTSNGFQFRNNGNITRMVIDNGGKVGIGTTTPNPSSLLEINSTTQGLLPPRMTMAQRNAISSPALGLMLYCTDCGGGEIEVYSGVDWRNMIGSPGSQPLAIGDSYGGGKVAYILQSGDPGYISGQVHGLITAGGYSSSGAEWGCYGTNLPGAEGIALGTGNQNTIDIVNECGGAVIAARICDNYVINIYSDWYLPSKDELNKLYINRVAIGGFGSATYWSSSEENSNLAWAQNFNTGSQGAYGKAIQYATLYVRAVRAF